MQLISRIFAFSIFAIMFISCKNELAENAISIPSKIDTSYKLYFTDSIFTYHNSIERNGKALIFIHGCPRGKHNHRSCLLNTPYYKNLVKDLIKCGWMVALIDLPILKDTSDYWSDGGLKYRGAYISKLKQVVEVLEFSDRLKYEWNIGGISYGGLHAIMGASQLKIFNKYFAILPVVKLNALAEFSKYCYVDYFDPFNELTNLKYSKGFISYNISDTRVNGLFSEILYDSLINSGSDIKRKIFNSGGHKINSDLGFILNFLNE